MSENLKDNNEEKYRIYRQMISSFFEQEQKQNKAKISSTGDIKIVPKIFYSFNSKNFKVEFYIGKTQMYKLRKLTEFYDRMVEHREYKYGLKLDFIHTKGAFEEGSIPLLDFIMKYSEIIKYVNDVSSNYFYSSVNNDFIVLSDSGMDDFFEACKNKKIELEDKYSTNLIEFLDNEPDVKFFINEESENDFTITTNIDVYNYSVINGKKYIYFLYDKKLYRCSKDFEKMQLKLLDQFRINYVKEIPFKKSEFSDFYSLIAPDIKQEIKINVDEENIEKYMPKELKVKAYLDTNNSNFIVCDLKFKYDEYEFSPFENITKKFPRNVMEESRALDMFKNAGFMLDVENRKLILTNDDKIYDFLKSGINEFINKFEVLATDEFKQKQIITPKISSIGVKIENDLLSIDLSELDYDPKDIEQIMKKYELKKKFHRLKNGQFIDLENNPTLDTLQKIAQSSNIEYKELASGTIHIPVYRSLYLDRILKKNDIVIKQNEEYKNLVDDVDNRTISDKFQLPKNLKATLREYQQVGFNWLETLDEYHLGGILCDDMGLGKTVQVLAVIEKYVEDNKNRKPSMVICPSSLTLNWQEEAKRFTPDLKTVVISGNQNERENKIGNINKFDIVITSYDLLKRDMDTYAKYNFHFKYLIADEAQYIKNNNTKNAKAIKELKGETRFALTGTPIENSLSELWSIFDFIMPEYLYSYNKFKSQYETPIVKEENEDVLQRLKVMIEPFTLRRVKEKVLTELPEKTITILNNEMTGEQLNIYLSYMQNARKKAKEEIEENGVAQSQMKILALLMRLRQICCQPGLFLENYTGESKKLTQCIEIIKDAVAGGHKLLVFSGYASMFPYIEKELKELNIKYLKLTGQTKVQDRMGLVNEFNNNDDVKVFLISLKAGGTGLNLVGADVVIHYDPWWNLSAENQATDRTYRIGQKRNVQVYKLITKNSIEEKIYNLQQKKAKLADDMLSTNETFISKLSTDEIMNLFE